MSLSDIMGHLGLDVYATAALVLFLAAFAAVMLNVFLSPRETVRQRAGLPLDDQGTPDAGAMQGGER